MTDEPVEPDRVTERPVAHEPVLCERVLTVLAPALAAPGAVAVDATLGLGGHSAALLADRPELRVVGIDRDPYALARAADRLERYGDRVTYAQAVYDELPAVLERLGLRRVDAVLFDLGVSSMQLDEVDRGFAYARDSPLDMRMDPTRGMTAADVLNTYPVARLARLLRDYGEERFAGRIAAAIVAEREKAPWTSSVRLADLVRDSIPAATRRTGGHPAKRTFQALRIEVNGELEALSAALPAAVDALRVGGRIAVLSYHSLEDRIVKRVLSSAARDTTPIGLPVELPAGAPVLRLLTRGAEKPTDAEVRDNPRAASARLRAAERVSERSAA
jgi:16S rRNA (cytosine1402-N4)-methyltransferase